VPRSSRSPRSEGRALRGDAGEADAQHHGLSPSRKTLAHWSHSCYSWLMSSAADSSHRKHLRRWEGRNDIRFITFSCYKRLPLLKHPKVMDLFAATMVRARTAHNFELYAWVVMPEHVHVLLRPRDGSTWENIATGWKSIVARQVLSRWRKLDAPVLRRLHDENGDVHFWQPGGGFDRNVRNLTEFTKDVRYIHRNPVDRGLAAAAADWRWTSVRWWMGVREGEVECDPPPGDPRRWEGWRGYM